MNKYCQITTTVSTMKDARKIMKNLLEKRLIACCQIQEINSCYWWNNRIEDEKEYLLIMKTKESLYNEIEKEILENHPYEVPEIVMTEIQDGYYEYLNWIKEETKNPKASI